ncbi:hypothetical protein [Methylobacterium sp. 190mf]|uniref:hypothetical protein n=1 Tax=Methylobacterium sp. 190mf TaxID=1761798 RepID=UPI0011B0EE05|nr:hypothetical protein [Methylobacterium sp. 190mf]
MPLRARRIRMIAAALCVASSAHADDLRSSYIWTLSAGGGTPKLGLQSRDPDRRSMAFERFFMTCRRAGGVEIVAWPVDPKQRDPEPGMPANLATDTTHHPLRGWRRSYNEMDEVVQISVVAPDLSPVRDMIGAASIRFGVEGISLALPVATSAVRGFLTRCTRYAPH